MGKNALHILLSSTNYNQTENLIQLVEFLLNDCRIDPEAKTNNNKDAFDILFDCCNQRKDLIDLFRLLVGPSIYPDPCDDQAKSALLPLCTSDDRIKELYKRFAHQLIESGAIDVNTVAYITPSDNDPEISLGLKKKPYHTTNKGSTVLHLICKNYEDSSGDLINLIRFLISEKVGANVNAVDSNKATPLHVLCQYYHDSNLKDIVEILIEKQINVSTQTDKDQRTALHCLCENQSGKSFKDVIELLIKNGADVTKTSYRSQNALHLLCEKYKGSDMLDVIKLLIEKGIQVDVVDYNAKNALHYICVKTIMGQT
jgi:ankyrin repeat protein